MITNTLALPSRGFLGQGVGIGTYIKTHENGNTCYASVREHLLKEKKKSIFLSS